MKTTDEKVFHLRKKPLYVGAILCSFQSIIGAWLLTLDVATIEASFKYNNHHLVYAVGIISICLFPYFTFKFLKKLLDKKTGLIINNIGIIDMVSNISPGLIRWSEITDAEIKILNKHKAIIVKLKNNEKYMKDMGIFNKVINGASFKANGSPIIINSSSFEIEFSEVVSCLKKYINVKNA